MLEERFSTIERENRILLEKMSHIMTHNTLDNYNASSKYSHSLNRGYRKRELFKITRENMAILKRIQQSEPTYNHYKWEDERRTMEGYIANIQEFRPKTQMHGSRSKGTMSRRPRTSNGTMDVWDSPTRGGRAGTAPAGAGRSAASLGRAAGEDLLLHSEAIAIRGDVERVWDLTVIEKGGVSAGNDDGMRGIEIWGRHQDKECAVGLTVDQLKELMGGAREDINGTMNRAVANLRLLDSRGVFSRFSMDVPEDVRELIIRTLIGRLTVVNDAQGMPAFQLLA